MQDQERLSKLRDAALAELSRAREDLEHLQRTGGSPTLIEWKNGYITALREILSWEGVSRRRNPRRPTAIPAEIVRGREAAAAPGEPGEGTIIDLSVGGCQVATRLALSLDEITEVSFQLPGSDRVVTLKALVRRVEQVGEEVKAGKEFQEVPEDVQEALESFCEGSGSLESRPLGAGGARSFPGPSSEAETRAQEMT